MQLAYIIIDKSKTKFDCQKQPTDIFTPPSLEDATAMSSLDWPHGRLSDMGEAHYRDLYKGRIDFGELGREDAALAAV